MGIELGRSLSGVSGADLEKEHNRDQNSGATLRCTHRTAGISCLTIPGTFTARRNGPAKRNSPDFLLPDPVKKRKDFGQESGEGLRADHASSCSLEFNPGFAGKLKGVSLQLDGPA